MHGTPPGADVHTRASSAGAARCPLPTAPAACAGECDRMPGCPPWEEKEWTLIVHCDVGLSSWRQLATIVPGCLSPRTELGPGPSPRVRCAGYSRRVRSRFARGGADPSVGRGDMGATIVYGIPISPRPTEGCVRTAPATPASCGMALPTA
ncbi:hypothetical protein GCM10009800_32830 [Nocardiopsis rhodophaea]